MTLYDKIKPVGMSAFGNNNLGHVDVKDIREFIEEIKIEINGFSIHRTGVHKGFLCSRIDKLSGFESSEAKG